ncbi:MAG: hypothetical protein OXC71_10345, partial [Chloroflexi bacterium]|nr:hypothetical protein [Chloroflexota bacterium]
MPQPPPPRPRPATAVGEWAARRQADVLLYLGAFLLVISALIFASSRDQVVFGGWRVALLGAYTAGFIAFGWLLRRWPRVREAGPVFLAIGALMTPLNFLLLYNEVLGEQGVSAALVWFIGSSYSAAFYAFVFAHGHGRLYALPAAASLLSAWAALGVTINVPFEWSGAWWMAFAIAGFGTLELTRRWSPYTAVPLGVIAALAVLFALLAPASLEGIPEHRWQLPVTHVLLLVMVVTFGAPRRPAVVIVAATLLAVWAAFTVVWAAEWDVQWYKFPPVIAAAVVLAARPRWIGGPPGLARRMSFLMAAGAVTPFALLITHLDGDAWVAAAAFFGTAALAAAIARLNTTDGVVGAGIGTPGPAGRSEPTPPIERVAFAGLGFVALLIAVAFMQRALGADAPDTGWAYAAVGVAASGAMVVGTRYASTLLWAALVAVLVATGVSLQGMEQFPGHVAVLLGLPAAHLLGTSILLRRWVLAGVAAALGMLALAALWESQGWEWWRLAALYAAASIALFGVLTRLRRYVKPGPDEAETLLVVQSLSWAPLVIAAVTAGTALDDRITREAIEAATAVEYRTLVLVVLSMAPLVAIEAWRTRRWEPGVVALLILLGAVAALWPVARWPQWTLAATFAGAGAAGFFALSHWRHPGTHSRDLAVQVLSWLTPAVAVLTAAHALDTRVAATALEVVGTVEYRTLVVTVLLLALLIGFEARRFQRWELAAVAEAVLVGGVVAAWPIFGWPTWTLAAALATAGVAGFVQLAPWRGSVDDARALAVQVMSWLPPVTAVFIAGYALDARLEGTAIEAVTTVEYRALVLVVLSFAPLIGFEARRFQRWELAAVAEAVLVGGVVAAWPIFGWPT